MSAPYVVCDWAQYQNDLDTRFRFPDSVAFHAAHGDSLSVCDAWRCRCGNLPSTGGFDPCNVDGVVDDAPEDEFTLWRCADCGVILNQAGEQVGQAEKGKRKKEAAS